MSSTVTLLSDFVDGTSMALMEETDAPDLNTFMTASQGRLWSDVLKKRRDRGLTPKRQGPGTLYFCSNEPGLTALQHYLESETNSTEEQHWLEEMKKRGVQTAPHIGSAAEQQALLNRSQEKVKRAKGFL